MACFDEYRNLMGLYDYCCYYGQGHCFQTTDERGYTDFITYYLEFLIENSPDDPDIEQIKRLYKLITRSFLSYKERDERVSEINKLMKKPMYLESWDIDSSLDNYPTIDRI